MTYIAVQLDPPLLKEVGDQNAANFHKLYRMCDRSLPVGTHIVETFTVVGIGAISAIARSRLLPTLTKGSKITPYNYGCPSIVLFAACYIKEV